MTKNSNPQNVFTGQIISVDLEEVELPNGRRMQVEVVQHPGGAAVVALDDKGRTCFLRQYRPVLNEWVWELPAGKIDDEEPPFETARRELEEEAGVIANRWHELGFMHSSPGVFTEKVYLYLAQELNAVEQQLEEHEIFEVYWLPFTEVLEQARSGVISDAKSVIALFRAARFLNF